MATRGQRNVGLGYVALGIIVMALALVFGLTTEAGGPDWIGIITGAAGVVLVIAGLFTALRGGATRAT